MMINNGQVANDVLLLISCINLFSHTVQQKLCYATVTLSIPSI